MMVHFEHAFLALRAVMGSKRLPMRFDTIHTFSLFLCSLIRYHIIRNNSWIRETSDDMRHPPHKHREVKHPEVEFTHSSQIPVLISEILISSLEVKDADCICSKNTVED